MGTGLLPVALFIDHVVLSSILLIASIVMNIIAIIKNFKEKRENKL